MITESPRRGTAHWVAVPGLGGDAHPPVPRALPSRPGGWASRADTASANDSWERPPQRDPWITRGLLWRRSCRLLMPVQHPDGARAYSCGATCGHRDVPAEPVERDLLLKVLVRAAFALKRPALVSSEERRRWQYANPLDSDAMLVAGFLHVEVDEHGDWHPAWRHETDREPTPASVTGQP